MSGTSLLLAGGGTLIGLALLGGVLVLVRTLAATRAELARVHARLDAASAARPAPDAASTRTPALPVPVVTDLGLPQRHEGAAASLLTTREVVEATLQRPLVRAAVWSAGLRHASRPESRDRARALARREYGRRAKLRRRAARYAARSAAVSVPASEADVEPVSGPVPGAQWSGSRTQERAS